MVKYEDVQVGDVIKYQFGFPPFEDEEPIVGISIAVTSKVCILEYTDYVGGVVSIPFSNIIEVYRKA